MAQKQQAKILTSLAGEYYVAAELCRRGYLASLTLKNYPKVDIFALNPVTHEPVAVQVKTIRRYKDRWLFFVPSDAAEYRGVFVFVIVGNDHMPYEAFVLTGLEVSARAEKARKEYVAKEHKRPLVEKDQPLMLGLPELDDRRDRWDIIFGVPAV